MRPPPAGEQRASAEVRGEQGALQSPAQTVLWLCVTLLGVKTTALGNAAGGARGERRSGVCPPGSARQALGWSRFLRSRLLMKLSLLMTVNLQHPMPSTQLVPVPFHSCQEENWIPVMI